MSARFERFAQMARDEFGLTVVKAKSAQNSTFESLFGVSAKSIAQYELPYNISAEQFGYYDDGAVVSNALEFDLPVEKFDASDYLYLAA